MHFRRWILAILLLLLSTTALSNTPPCLARQLLGTLRAQTLETGAAIPSPILALSHESVQTYAQAEEVFTRMTELSEAAVHAMSDTQLLSHVQANMDRLYATGRKYLPGCSPDWNPKDAFELVEDFVRQTQEGNSWLRNIIGNVGSGAESNREVLRMFAGKQRPFDGHAQQMATAVQRSIWDYAVYQELRRRLIQ